MTAAPGDAGRIAVEAARAGVRRLIVVGGDGTVHEAVNGLMAAGLRDVVLGYVPTGTGCDLARALGLPASAEGAVRALAGALPRRIDLGFIEPGRGEGRFFVNAANVGVGPRIAARIDSWKALGRLSYVTATAWELLRSGAEPLCLRHDGDTSEAPMLNVSICNGPYFGGGMCPDPAASLDSGRLNVVRVSEGGRVQSLWLLPRLMGGRLGAHPRLRRFTTSRLEVVGSGAIEADGEIVGELPAAFEVVKGALQVLAPAR